MVVLYGAGPINDARWPWETGEAQTPQPIIPETAEQLQARLEARIKWLENEIRMQEAYKSELKFLETTLETLKAQRSDK
jgi:hypothetical protein